MKIATLKHNDNTKDSTRTDKLEALVHYISYKCTDPTKLGATKLNKALWYSDAHSFLVRGKPITGTTYIKKKFGPVPQQIAQVSESLVNKGALAITKDLHFGYPQTQFIALKRPDLSSFTAEEISFVDEVLAYICENHTAISISEKSHDAVWEAAAIGEEIPIYAFLATRFGTTTKEDIEWATGEAQKAGLIH